MKPIKSQVVYPSEIKNSHTKNLEDISPIDAFRYVSHRYYAPKRLWVEDDRISQTPIYGNQKLDFFFRGKSFGLTIQSAQASWKTGRFFTTAIKVSNISNQSIKLDYSDINYDFEYAVFQHLGLQKGGAAGDTTMLYLITRVPFNSSLHPWLPESDNKDG